MSEEVKDDIMPPQPEEIEESENEGEVETTAIQVTPHDNIAAALNSLTAIGDIDVEIQSERRKSMIREIRWDAYYIIHSQLRFIRKYMLYIEDEPTNESTE